ncbi:unnamed protein product [Heligmosomoides polygyrus]|uniref:Uncharacterized protein n=1 Tax=Heligmosomoides polygyrus TaxID=6339 RepID=A0A183GKZ6_HELPZ|nr:unnamed protein product [Heligmosomoides polygyrus]
MSAADDYTSPTYLKRLVNVSKLSEDAIENDLLTVFSGSYNRSATLKNSALNGSKSSATILSGRVEEENKFSCFRNSMLLPA